MSFRSFRILVLLGVLVLTTGFTWWEQRAVTRWERPLEVVIYPINGEGGVTEQAYVDGLDAGRFEEIAAFMKRQGARYLMKKMPAVHLRLGPEIKALPPAQPKGTRSMLDSLLWSLKLRYFAFSNTPFFDSIGKIRLFVVYHEGEDGKPLQHSLGMSKGLFGVVHAFAQAKQDDQNNIVIAHELLHTLGATDKYDARGMPVYPEGFGEPGDSPQYPQREAEIMAGRVAISPDYARIPANLGACGVGYKTAHEINW